MQEYNDKIQKEITKVRHVQTTHPRSPAGATDPLKYLALRLLYLNPNSVSGPPTAQDSNHPTTNIRFLHMTMLLFVYTGGIDTEGGQ